MKCKPNDRVRTVHGSIGVQGIALEQAENSPIDGSERWLVEWTLPDGSVHHSRWSPDLLVPLDEPRENDPPAVLAGISSDGTRKAWLTRKGIMWTDASVTEDAMLLLDMTLFDVIFADTKDR